MNQRLNAYIVFQPSFGSLSNIFGRRPLMLTALILFLVGAIVAGISTNFLHMLVGRSIQGIGGGGVIALSEIIVTDLVPLRLRGQYFGVVGSMASVGAVTGPLLGGGFSEKVSWVSRILRLVLLCFTPGSLLMMVLEMDFLYQFPIHRDRNHSCYSLPQSSFYSYVVKVQTTAN
jgi:MFS family permease